MIQNKASQLLIRRADVFYYSVLYKGVERVLLVWPVGIEFLTRLCFEKKVFPFLTAKTLLAV